MTRWFRRSTPTGTASRPKAEWDAYCGRVSRDLSVSVDGKPVVLRRTTTAFPDLADMKAGVGEILLNLKVNLPLGKPSRRIVFENHHQAAIAAYLVNCLVPANPTIHVTAQDRNYDQSFHQLDYIQSGGTAADVPPAASSPGFFERLAQSGNVSLARAFFAHGVWPILTGYNHLLFISALVLAATTFGDLVKVVTAFTLAHTITLTLAAMDWVHLPPQIVGPLISASIVFVAVQNMFWPGRSIGWSRLSAAFFFGLFHGLAFAGGLLDAMRGVPGGTLLLAIFGFSAGVEAGHQSVAIPLFLLLRAVRRAQPDVVARTRITVALRRFGSAGISLAAAYYLCLALTGHF